MRILVIEDELQLARHVTRALTRHGHDVVAQHDGAEGLAAALDHPPDLIVLDLNLPSLDGFTVLARLREAKSHARVLILTARGEVENRVRGLKAGADDYLAKPFSMEELVARVEALGRRAATPTAADLLEVADLHMDVQHRRVTRAGSAHAGAGPDFFANGAVRAGLAARPRVRHPYGGNLHNPAAQEGGCGIRRPAHSYHPKRRLRAASAKLKWPAVLCEECSLAISTCGSYFFWEQDPAWRARRL
jgi:CheY-like chemotaxis protein